MSDWLGYQELWWPVQQPGIDTTFTLDISADIAANPNVTPPIPAFTISEVSAQVKPSGAGELQPVALSVTGGVITIELSGGVAARTYDTEFTVTCTSSGVANKTLVYIAHLPMSNELATWPIPYPPSFDFGTPITWSA